MNAVVLVAHGTVASLDELGAFLTTIRRGHAPPPELLAEVRRRYEAIGGKSPLNDINQALACKLERELGLPVRLANRLTAPGLETVFTELQHVERVVAIPLAQHSSGVYADACRAAHAAVDARFSLVCAPNWGRAPGLVRAYGERIDEALAGVGSSARVVMTAHSLPLAVLRRGDPYEREVRAAAEAIGANLRGPWTVAFQSQGLGSSGDWLGPNLQEVFDASRREGHGTVVVAPTGFLADHVEVLYDLDVEARAWATERGLALVRTRSLNDDDDLVQVLAVLARDLLGA
jgi:ferrochelatase